MRGLLLICLTGLCAGSIVFAQTAAATAKPAAQNTSQLLVAQAVSAPAPSAALTKATAASQPLWTDLSTTEQAALRPLAANWNAMSLERKRKWLNVAKDFEKLTPAQKASMQTRMTEWSGLSPQQRADARQNFAQNRELTDGLTSEQRKVQWQAYERLSPEEKRKLAESAPKASVSGAAPAAKPQPVLKKEPTPEFGTGKVLAKAKAAPNSPAAGKKIAVAPYVASQGSILPGNASDPADKP